MVRHDHRKEADGDADIGENEEADRAEEGRGLRIVVERPPGKPGDGRGSQRHRRQERNVRPCEPARGDALAHEWGPDADDANRENDPEQAGTTLAAGGSLDFALSLEDEPTGPQQAVAE